MGQVKFLAMPLMTMPLCFYSKEISLNCLGARWKGPRARSVEKRVIINILRGPPGRVKFLGPYAKCQQLSNFVKSSPYFVAVSNRQPLNPAVKWSGGLIDCGYNRLVSGDY